MLTHVLLDSSEPTTLHLDSVDPDELIILKSISGLSPADITLFTGEFAGNSGYYQGRRVAKRNPVFNLKLNPDYKNDVSTSDLRERLYQIFLEPLAGRDGLRVVLYDDKKPDREFTCYTEKFEADIFAKNTDPAISTLSVDAYLQSVNETTATEPGGYTTFPLTYEGSAKTGLSMTLNVKVNTNVITVDINGARMVLDRTLAGGFLAGDVVIISTRELSRRITRNGTDIMAALTGASRWLQLRRGLNTIKIFGIAENDGKAVMTSYRYRAEWWGV